MSERTSVMSALRTFVSLGFLGLLGVGGYYIYRQQTTKDREIAEQKRIIAGLEKKLDLAWATEVVADVRVDQIKTDAAGKKTLHLTFAQYAPGTDKEIFKKKLKLSGEELYIDALVVTFDRKLVEAGEGLKGKSMFIFRRAFGSEQRPVDGTPLYVSATEGMVPDTLRVDDVPGPYEQGLWEHFWELANDPSKAKDEGVRFAQGEAPHVKAVEGQVYRLKLRATGGLEMTPLLTKAVLGKD